MNARTTTPWLASAGLHGLLLLLAFYTWKVTPITNPDPAISVDIIADVASTIGQDNELAETNNEIAKNAEPIAAPPQPEEIVPEPIAAPAPKAPLPPVKAAPQIKKQLPPKAEPKAPAPIARVTPKQPPPATKTTQSPTPKTTTRSPPPAAARPSPQTKGQASPMFDIAAATANASGVNAGGRRSPQLSKSSGAAAKAKGSGSRLQGNLAGALRQQIKNCWYEPADLSNPGRLIVEIAIELSPDGNLARPPRLVTPASRNGADSTLLIAIDNAIRAARQCAPYDLPSDRYDEWQSFNFRFDPREMRRLP